MTVASETAVASLKMFMIVSSLRRVFTRRSDQYPTPPEPELNRAIGGVAARPHQGAS
jgi:hypothetical protein